VSGKKPAWSKNPHRGDCFLDDGQKDAKRDLSGGFHDAGDCIKVVVPAFSNCSQFVFGALFNKEAYKASGQYEMIVSIIRHYCDWGIKCHEIDGQNKTIKLWHWVSDNKIDHATMLPPERQEAEYYKPKGLYRQAFAIGDGHEPVGEEPPSLMAATFALTYMLLKDEDRMYAEELLKRSKSLFTFAQQRRGKYTAHSVYSSNSYGDEITFAAITLNLATGDTNYLTKAEEYFNAHIGVPSWTWMPDNHSSISTFLLAYTTKNPKYIKIAKDWIDCWVKGTNGVRKHPNSPLRSNADWGTIPQFAATFALALFGNKHLGFNDPNLTVIAKQGMDYCLGDNPKNFSWLGGFGVNYPKNMHHRSLMSNKSIVGLGLWAAGEKMNGEYNDKDDDYVTNECGGYTSSLAMLLSFMI
jgi:hypothetical protein